MGRYRGYHILVDWAPGPRRLLCVGYRGSTAATDDTGPIGPPACRDGEAVHYDSEDSLRAVIDATYETPAEAALWRSCEAPADPADVAAAMAAEATT